MKKKPRRRHKKGKGSPSGLGPNKKGAGNSSTVSARTDVTQSMHLSDYTCIPVGNSSTVSARTYVTQSMHLSDYTCIHVASTCQMKMDLCLSARINLSFKCLVYYNID